MGLEIVFRRRRSKLKTDKPVCFKYLYLNSPCEAFRYKTKNIETASFLFYKNGYSMTGINEVIPEADIAKGSLYSHFKSKENICFSYLQFKNEALLNEI